MSNTDKAYVPTDKELELAYIYWLNLLKIYQNEEKLFYLFDVSVPKDQLWLKLARESSFLSMEKIASKMGISKNAYNQIEKSELEGKITIKTLKKAASAIDCELVYFIRPCSGKTFSSAIWSRLLKVCTKAKRFKTYRAGKIALPLAYHALEVLKSAKFRKENNLIKVWSGRK